VSAAQPPGPAAAPGGGRHEQATVGTGSGMSQTTHLGLSGLAISFRTVFSNCGSFCVNIAMGFLVGNISDHKGNMYFHQEPFRAGWRACSNWVCSNSFIDYVDELRNVIKFLGDNNDITTWGCYRALDTVPETLLILGELKLCYLL
jgi:hypothetical protein